MTAKTIQIAVHRVLCTEDPQQKASNARDMARHWRSDHYSIDFSGDEQKDLPETKYPGRPAKPELVSPKDVKRRRLGSLEGRISLLHAIAHIEFNAINLAADMVYRFAADPRIADEKRKDFISDWVSVCDDEARHFMMIKTRLGELGSHYGALPAHDGLWDAAISTMHDVAARLVIAPMVLEARGLDVTPKMIEKLQNVDDHDSANILTTIYNDEIGHVAAGSRWFSYLCDRENRDENAYFQLLLKAHFAGNLKPPFNLEARDLAGMRRSFYRPELSVN